MMMMVVVVIIVMMMIDHARQSHQTYICVLRSHLVSSLHQLQLVAAMADNQGDDYASYHSNEMVVNIIVIHPKEAT